MDAKITVLISEELHRQAKAAVARRGETLSDVVRTALEEYIAETERIERDPRRALQEDPLLSLRFHGGPSDVAERAEEILADTIDPIAGFRVDP